MVEDDDVCLCELAGYGRGACGSTFCDDEEAMYKSGVNKRRSARQYNGRADRTDRRNLVVVRRGGYRL